MRENTRDVACPGVFLFDCVIQVNKFARESKHLECHHQ